MEKRLKIDLNLCVSLACQLRNQGFMVSLDTMKHCLEEVAARKKIEIEDDLKNYGVNNVV